MIHAPICTRSTEYPKVKTFAIHPGAVDTAMTRNANVPDVEAWLTEKPELVAAVSIALASGRLDWLSGRFFDSRWDIDEVEKLKERILEKDLLVSKLAVKLD